MSKHANTQAAWYCTDCSQKTTAEFDTACRVCCGFRSSAFDLRTEVGKALEPLWWMRQYVDDDSDAARDLDAVRAFSQGTDEL